MRTEPAPTPGVLAAYAHCRELTLRSGSSFAAAFWMFPREQRRAVHAIYAFCRFADDIADDPRIRGDRATLLDRWREELAAAYAGGSQHPVGIALGDAVRRFDLPRELAQQHRPLQLEGGREQTVVHAPRLAGHDDAAHARPARKLFQPVVGALDQLFFVGFLRYR